MTGSAIYFVAHHLRRRWPEVESSTAQIPMDDVPASRWAPGENIWIVSTYLRLRALGLPVYLVDRVQPEAINVYHEWEAIRSPNSHRGFLVFTQGDRSDHPWADFTVSQSPAMLGARHALIDCWPQPGLIPRDTERGDRLERIGYVGPLENLAAPYRAAAFKKALREVGVELVIRDDPSQWRDFSDLDAFLAVRDWPWHLIRTKPATKLVHAWLTGSIGLLGPEPSYQHWGSDGKDYFEVRTPADVLGVVKRLKADPALCQRVRQRGFEKGREHDEQAVIQQWIDVLNGPVREAFERWQSAGPLTWQARRWRRRYQRVVAPLSQKLFTLRSRGLRRALGRRLRKSADGSMGASA